MLTNNIYFFLERGYPRDLHGLASRTGFHNLLQQTRLFLYKQLNPDTPNIHITDVPDSFLQAGDFDVRVNVFHSASVVYFAPSDPSGTGGMRREHIRSTPSWRKGAPRYDTVFIETDPDLPGMRGMHVARVFILFSFVLDEIDYPCALVHWFEVVDDQPDKDTGMWIVSPEFRNDETMAISVVHVDCIVRAAHLIPVYGPGFVVDAHELDFSQSLDNFQLFYVNKYADHHTNEIVF